MTIRTVLAVAASLALTACAMAQRAGAPANAQPTSQDAAVAPAPALPSGPIDPAPPIPALAGLADEAPLFPGATHDASVPTVEHLVGFPAGERAATHAEIEKCLRAWDGALGRTRLFRYATTHEGRSLYYFVITSPENMARLDQIKQGWSRLADPRGAAGADLDRLARELPAIAWMAYTIHGDETSGSDAALALAYHLSSCADADVRALLDKTVVIIDPIENPDGRDRFLKQVREHRSALPNVDDQSLLHAGYWPWGRANHYLFDMNRDWIYGTQPETRGRIAAAGSWHPLLFVDSHEMGSQDTFLFSPSREPLNPHTPPAREAWWTVFSRGIADAFDTHGWRYYSGEWNEGWFPGYSDAWASFRGAVGMLYEQARLADAGVRLASGVIVPYRESVRHQVTASMANLRTLAANADALKRGFLEERRAAIAPDGANAQTTYAVVPGGNVSRERAFIDLMRLQGFDVSIAGRPFSADATDRLGRREAGRSFPAGTILVPARQPESALLSVMLDFDPRMSTAFLRDERRELLRFGRSKLYDVTAWNITMMHDVDAYTLAAALPEGAEPAPADARPPDAAPPANTSPTAYIIDGADDNSVAAAARLMDRGAEVRAADRPFRFDDAPYARGSILVALDDNRSFPGGADALVRLLADVCGPLGLRPRAVASGRGGSDEAPDIGGEHFVLLARPRVALVSRGNTSFTSYGAAWFTIDQRLGERASHLDADTLGDIDLRRYNVLVVPDTFGESTLARVADKVKDWVRAGGTLIAIGGSAEAAANEKLGLSSVRLLPDVLDKLSDYEVAALREWEGRRTEVDPAAVWSSAAPTDVAYPWGDAGPKVELDDLKRRDAWQRIFMPSGGAIVAGRVDDKHWLTCGLRDYVPILYSAQQPLMAAAGVDAPVRLGVFVPDEEATKAAPKTDPPKSKKPDAAAPDAKAEEADEKEKQAPRVGWALLPKGQKLLLRMSGLLWPEAAARAANSAYVTRESVGDGQVILFASDPVFRAASMGTGRIFVNAVVLGPGMGARQPIDP